MCTSHFTLIVDLFYQCKQPEVNAHVSTTSILAGGPGIRHLRSKSIHTPFQHFGWRVCAGFGAQCPRSELPAAAMTMSAKPVSSFSRSLGVHLWAMVTVASPVCVRRGGGGRRGAWLF